jgi:hypothetical protein
MRSYSHPFPILLATALSLALASAARPAAASGNYPTDINSKLGVSGDPPLCTICHRDLSGGSGTVIQPFGVQMVANFGLTGGAATDKLNQALDDNEAAKNDADGDGQPDVDELKAGTNPSLAGGSAVAPAKYGCFESGGTIASAPPGSPRLMSLAMAGAVAALLFWRRRR